MQNLASASGLPESPALYSVPEVLDIAPWYVAYARPRHEKYIAHQLEQRGIRSLVPLYFSLRRWKDRKKRLELPLFPCYVFVQIALEHKIEVLRLPGVVDLVGSHGKPVPMLNSEIETLRNLNAITMAHPYPYLEAGRKVRVRCGALEGLEGIFVRRRGQSRVVLSVSLIQRSVAIEIDDADVEPIS